RGARGTRAQGRRSRDLCPRGLARGPMGRRSTAGSVRHAGRARSARLRTGPTMFAYVQGTLVAATPLQAVVDVQGLGYEINIPVTTAERLPAIGGTVKLFTHAVYREDSQALFGFA